MFEAEFRTNPYATYRHMRSSGRIHWVNNSFGGAWFLPHYVDIAAAFHDSRLSARRSQIVVDRLPSENRAEFADFSRLLSMWLINIDPPDHSRLRGLLNKGFQPALLQGMRLAIQKIADMLLDKVIAKGQMEFMHDFAYPLPALVIAKLLGVPSSDQHDFFTWSDDIADFFGSQPTVASARLAQKRLMTLTEYFRTHLPTRLKEAGNDLVALLAQHEAQDHSLSSDQLLAQCSLLFLAGHETTRNFLGNGLLTLLHYPDQLALLKKDPSLMPNTLRELLRYESPIQFVARRAVVDIPGSEYGQPVKQGQVVFSLLGSANRDPAKFTNPDTLDISRKESSHLAFGAGPHVCLGAALAYLEAEIAFRTLFQRLPHLRLATDKPDWHPKSSLRMLKTLWLTF